MNYTNLAKVLKYSMDTVENLLEQLHNNPLARHSDMSAGPSSNPHAMQRLVTADALQDAGRDQEADILRNLKQHVVVRNGKVLAGMRSIRHFYNNVIGLDNAMPVGTALPIEYLSDDKHPAYVNVRRAGEYAHNHPPLKIHYTELPKLMADRAREYITNMDVMTPDLERRLKDIENSPVEDADPYHPLNKGLI